MISLPHTRKCYAGNHLWICSNKKVCAYTKMPLKWCTIWIQVRRNPSHSGIIRIWMLVSAFIFTSLLLCLLSYYFDTTNVLEKPHKNASALRSQCAYGFIFSVTCALRSMCASILLTFVLIPIYINCQKKQFKKRTAHIHTQTHTRIAYHRVASCDVLQNAYRLCAATADKKENKLNIKLVAEGGPSWMSRRCCYSRCLGWCLSLLPSMWSGRALCWQGIRQNVYSLHLPTQCKQQECRKNK